MNPASGSGFSQTFSFSANPVSGSLAWVQIDFNTVLQRAQSCLVLYDGSSGQIFLASDDAQSWYAATPGTPGAPAIGNSQCTIDVAGSSVQSAGSGITHTLPISFSTAWSGRQQYVWMAAADTDDNEVDWPIVGTWNIP
jgi:hypothetical protein